VKGLISNMIENEMSLRDFAANLPYILSYIFALDKINTSGDTIDSKSSLLLSVLNTNDYKYSRDANTVLNFLSPDGIFLRLLYQCKTKHVPVRNAHVAMDSHLVNKFAFFDRFLGKKRNR